MAEINPTAAGGLPPVTQAAQRAAARPADAKANAPGRDTPSIRIDPGLLARIEENSELKGVDQNLDADGARSLARESQEQLASQTLSIANQAPQTVQGLFR
jgi:hypothetical protein